MPRPSLVLLGALAPLIGACEASIVSPHEENPPGAGTGGVATSTGGGTSTSGASNGGGGMAPNGTGGGSGSGGITGTGGTGTGTGGSPGGASGVGGSAPSTCTEPKAAVVRLTALSETQYDNTVLDILKVAGAPAKGL